MKIKTLLLIAGILVVAGIYISDRTAEDPDYLSSKVADAGAMTASTFISFEQYDAAVTCADFVSTVDPDNPALLRIKGEALSAVGKYDEAVACYDDALTSGGEDATTLAKKAQALLKAGDLNGAVEACTAALAIDQTDLSALQTAGAASLYLGEYDQAVGYYDQLVEVRPDDAAAWIKKGDALLYISLQEEEKMKKAFKNLTGTTSATSTNFDSDAYMEAMECFNKAIALDPKTAPLLAARLLARSQISVQTCEDIVKDLG